MKKSNLRKHFIKQAETELTEDSILLLNRIMTPDGTILTSRHRHDYVQHRDKNGNTYMVDGGLDYLRRAAPNDYTEMSVYSHHPFDIIRKSIEWGTYGKNGDEELKYIPISEMSDSHIKAVISLKEDVINKRPLTYFEETLIKIMKLEIKYRKKHNITIQD